MTARRGTGRRRASGRVDGWARWGCFSGCYRTGLSREGAAAVPSCDRVERGEVEGKEDESRIQAGAAATIA